MIEDCRRTVGDFRNGNSQLAIENALETPKRGQGAECPDRIFTKSGLFLRQIFWE
jgi:hypothetical protein